MFIFAPFQFLWKSDIRSPIFLLEFSKASGCGFFGLHMLYFYVCLLLQLAVASHFLT